MSNIFQIKDKTDGCIITVTQQSGEVIIKTVPLFHDNQYIEFVGTDGQIYSLGRSGTSLRATDGKDILNAIMQMPASGFIEVQNTPISVTETPNANQNIEKAVTDFLALLVGPEAKENAAIGTHTARIKSRNQNDAAQVRKLFTDVLAPELRTMLTSPGCNEKLRNTLLTGTKWEKERLASAFLTEVYVHKVFGKDVQFERLGLEGDWVKSFLEFFYAVLHKFSGDPKPLEAWNSRQTEVTVKDVNAVEQAIKAKGSNTFQELILAAADSSSSFANRSGAARSA